MQDELLLKLVQKFPVLYDISHPKYMDVEFKNKIWMSIGDEMEEDGQLCKTRWANIRDNYRKSLRKTKDKNIKRYKYSEQLCFLTKYFEEREMKSNNNDTKAGEDVNQIKLHKNEENKQDNSKELNNSETNNLQIQSLPIQKEKNTLECPILRKKSKRVAPAPQEAAGGTLMHYGINKNEGLSSNSSTISDPVDAFLVGIAPALKKLTPLYWHYAKGDIFAAVQKYEIKMLLDQDPLEETSHFSPISNHSEQPSPARTSQHYKLETDLFEISPPD